MLEGGWIRTGTDSSPVNCLAWTSSSGSVSGSRAALETNWLATLPRFPWLTSFDDCNVAQRVRRVED